MASFVVGFIAMPSAELNRSQSTSAGRTCS